MRRRIVVATGVVVGCLALSLITTVWSFGAYFVGDDLGEIQRAANGDTRGAHTRPVVTILLRASHAVGGLDPRAYHAVNLVLHAAAIGCVGWAAASMASAVGLARARSRSIGVGTAVVFALLATHAEAVSWISARGDVIATAAAAAALAVWSTRRVDGRVQPVGVAVACGAVLLGLLAKEQAVVVPFMCGAVGVAVQRARRAPWVRSIRHAALEALPLIGVLLGYVLIRGLVLGSLVGSYSTRGSFDWSPMTLVLRQGSMVARTVVPGGPTGSWVAVSAIVALGGAAAVLARRSVRSAFAGPVARLLGLGVVLIMVAVVPGVGLGVSLADGRGDRLLYLASAASALVLAVIGEALWSALPGRAPRWAMAAVAVALLGASAVLAVSSDRTWAEAGRLAEQTLADEPLWEDERPIVVLNPADVLRGAYVHRNTLGDAAYLVHGWDAPGEVRSLAPMELDRSDAEVHVRRTGPRSFDLVAGPGARFLPLDGSEAQAGGVRVRLDGSVLHVDLGTEVNTRDVWYLSDGRFSSLADVDR